MNRINQEGADYLSKLLDGILDSITKKLTGPQVKKIEDELATLADLQRDVQDKWDKV